MHRVRRVLISIMLASGVMNGCTSGPSAPEDSTYAQKLAVERAEKDQLLRDGPDSPLLPGTRDKILPLKYFPIDAKYAVPGVLRLDEQRTPLEIPTSTGQLRKMERVGILDFTFEGQQLSLAAFVEAGEQVTNLFVPFADMTTGAETYPAGRYLDLFPTATGFYTIDFNRAYNPYCAYNAKYDCPYPPQSNRLKVAIRAGERVPPA